LYIRRAKLADSFKIHLVMLDIDHVLEAHP
jgi:hypothetical protein